MIRSMGAQKARVASSAVEHSAFNRLVLSSNLRRPISFLALRQQKFVCCTQCSGRVSGLFAATGLSPSRRSGKRVRSRLLWKLHHRKRLAAF